MRFETEYDFDEPVPIALTTSDGKPVAVGLRRLLVGPGATLVGTMDVDTLRRVVAGGCLNIDEEFHDGWDDTTDADVTIGLRSDLVVEPDQADGLLVSLVSGDAVAATQESSWYLLEASQSIGVPTDPSARLDIGIRTRWADDGTP